MWFCGQETARHSAKIKSPISVRAVIGARSIQVVGRHNHKVVAPCLKICEAQNIRTVAHHAEQVVVVEELQLANTAVIIYTEASIEMVAGAVKMLSLVGLEMLIRGGELLLTVTVRT